MLTQEVVKILIVSDNETQIDLLYFEPIAQTIVDVILDKDSITIGAHGDWGAGKSSILMMIEHALKNKKGVLCVRFNGWLFQGFDDTKIILIETIIEAIKSCQNQDSDKKITQAIDNLLKTVNWMKLAKMATNVASSSLGMPLLLSNNESWLKKISENSTFQHIHEFRAQFQELLEASSITKLVVLIDDLDRCLPETAIATMEAIRLFLQVPGTAFVIAADEGMIEYAVRQHFPDLHQGANGAQYSRNYLEKIIQLPFRLPALGFIETKTFILLLHSSIDLEPRQFESLIDAAKETLKRPWESSGLSRESIEKALGEIPESVEQAYQLSEQLADALTRGTNGNPRQIKRFINTLSTKNLVAKARGFESQINFQVLAKILLAEQFHPSFFDKIANEATSSKDGISTSLQEVEQKFSNISAPKKSKQTDKIKSKKDTSTASDNDSILQPWVGILPSLSEVDLRPYIFVTKDSRKLKFLLNTSSHLDNIYQSLISGRMAAANVTPDIKALDANDANILFNRLSSSLSSTTNLKNEPKEKIGLSLIAMHHSNLRPALIVLLGELPTSDLGAWVTVGWKIEQWDAKDQSAFEELLNKWTQQTENSLLTAASKSVKLRK